MRLFPTQMANMSARLPGDTWTRKVVMHDMLNIRLLRMFRTNTWLDVYQEWTGICLMLVNATSDMDAVLSPSDVPEATEYLATSTNQQELDESEVNTSATIPAAGESRLCTSR